MADEPKFDGIVPRNISTEMREAYLDYAMSVITSRALPDVRDGLKPCTAASSTPCTRLGLDATVALSQVGNSGGRCAW
jgi:hypothetical protein